VRIPWLAAAALTAGACSDTPRGDASLPLPHPSSLERGTPASDLRVDTGGVLLGSLVGEGTADGVHAVSNDTAVILALLSRARPSAGPRQGFRTGAPVRLDPGRGDLAVGDVVVASPRGYTRGRVRELLVRSDDCGTHPIAELVVEAATGPLAGGPPLIGPVLVSLRTKREREIDPPGFMMRTEASVTASDIAAVRGLAEALVDSALALHLPSEWLPLRSPRPSAVQVNVLDDIDGVDVVAFHAHPSGGYAVAIRERRITATDDTILATGSYTWVANRIRPLVAATAFRLARGALTPLASGLAPAYARRLSPLAGFGSSVDHLWFELVDVAAGSVTWTVIAPESHTVAAAATVVGRCPR